MRLLLVYSEQVDRLAGLLVLLNGDESFFNGMYQALLEDDAVALLLVAFNIERSGGCAMLEGSFQAGVVFTTVAPGGECVLSYFDMAAWECLLHRLTLFGVRVTHTGLEVRSATFAFLELRPGEEGTCLEETHELLKGLLGVVLGQHIVA